MKIVFISNYINHHQIPFCEAMAAMPDVDFTFVQSEPMEAERIALGWGVDVRELPYVRCLGGGADAADGDAGIRESMRGADILIVGGLGPLDIVDERLRAGRPVFRISERIYREGEWKRFSPRGLVHKWKEHIRYRDMPLYLLCAGAYTASDFERIGAYPGKMYQWGYFPRTRVLPAKRRMELEAAAAGGGAAARTGAQRGPVRLCWAGRFIPLKHPDFPVRLAADLSCAGIGARLTMIGGGEMEDELRALAAAQGADVVFTGVLPPEEVRSRMEAQDIFLFTSNHLEGWGAVVGEAMNAGCAPVCGAEAGGPVTLIRHGESGLLYEGESYEAFRGAARSLAADPARTARMGLAAAETILGEWNSACAAERLAAMCRSLLAGGDWQPPAEGPMSPAPVIRPFVIPPRMQGAAAGEGAARGKEEEKWTDR